MTGEVSAAAVPLVGKKLMNRLGGMANEGAAAEVSDFAKRQMEKMGWSKGKGLGKNEQGVKSHVKVKRREELQGVGAEKVAVQEIQNQWWYNVYDRMASKIVIDASDEEEGDEKKRKKKEKKDKKRKREEKKDKFRIPTDEELFAATGGKLFGRRAYGSCSGKLKRDELQLQKAKQEEEPVTDGSDASEKERKRAKKLKKKAKKAKKSKAEV
jgi:Pin2-interacting protein X1